MRAKLRVNFDRGQDLGENKAKEIRRPCDSISRNLNKTSVREKSRGIYLQIGRVFPSYSIIAYVEREKIMRGCG